MMRFMCLLLLAALAAAPAARADARQIVRKTFGLSVRARLVIATATPLPDAVEGAAYSVKFVATGGKTPYAWTVVSCQKQQSNGTVAPCAASLPGGYALAADGTLAGTPTEPGAFTVMIQAADSP